MLKKLIFLLHHHPSITDSLSAGCTHSVGCIMVFLFEDTSSPTGPNIRDKGAGWNHNKGWYVWGTDAGVNPRVPWARRTQSSCIWATLLIWWVKWPFKWHHLGGLLTWMRGFQYVSLQRSFKWYVKKKRNSNFTWVKNVAEIDFFSFFLGGSPVSPGESVRPSFGSHWYEAQAPSVQT